MRKLPNPAIRKIETDTASTHDNQHFDNVFDTTNMSREVWAIHLRSVKSG